MSDDVYYVKDLEVAITTFPTKSSFGMTDTVSKLNRTGKVAFWGDNNLFPNEIAKDIKTSSLLGFLIDWKAKKLYSEGLVYGNWEVDKATGFERFMPFRDNEIEDWMERSNINLQLQRGFNSWYTLENIFPILQKSKGNGAAGLFYPDSFKCRLGLRDEKSGRIEQGFMAADWSEVSGVDDSAVQKYAALHPDYDVAGQIVAAKEEFLMLPIRHLTLGQNYYGLASWNGLRESKWYDVAQAVVRWKLAFLMNSSTLRYHIEIHDDFWPAKYPDWDEKKQLQEQRKQDEVTAFNKWAKGEQSAGRTLMTSMRHRAHEKGSAAYSMWKVTPLPLNLPTGAYIEDSQEADFQIARAFGVPVSLIGMGPGKKMGSGSGSDLRIAGNQYLIDVRGDADTCLSVMNAISRVNGWNTRLNQGRPIKWMTKSVFTATRDTLNNVAPTPASDVPVPHN